MPFEQVNGKVVSVPVAPGREVLARRGAMLAYTGQVQFAPVRAAAGGMGGMGGMAGRMMAGEQVQMMVMHMLKLTSKPQIDASDALAIAICHAHTRSSLLPHGLGTARSRGGRLRL